MPRETFQQELDGLISDVAAFGDEVEGSLKNTVVAMEARDADVARQELGVDARYKARGMGIERGCMLLQARQAPVARDLRLLYTVHVFTVSAVLVLLLASAALAQNYGGGMNASPTATASATASPTATASATASPSATATATATASATATATALPTTGGPPLGGLVTWAATLTLIGSGVGALVLLRGGGAVS